MGNKWGNGIERIALRSNMNSMGGMASFQDIRKSEVYSIADAIH